MPALAVKTEAKAPRRPVDTQFAAQLTEHELFVAQKRNEATLRDITGKAVCAVKRALRQHGAQADGRPAIPSDWDSSFKPQLGSFMKFVLGRPDQFRVLEGAGPGFYTVENVAGNKTVVAPSWDQKGKGAEKAWGKGKSKGKGKVSEAGKRGGGLKGAAASGGQQWGKGNAMNVTNNGNDSTSLKNAASAPVSLTHKPVLPRAARLLAHAAKVELAAEEGETAEDIVPPTGGHAEAEQEQDDTFGGEEDDVGEDGEPADNEDWDSADATGVPEAPADEDGEDVIAEANNDGEVMCSVPTRGSFIRSMLSASLLGDSAPGSKRRRVEQ